MKENAGELSFRNCTSSCPIWLFPIMTLSCGKQSALDEDIVLSFVFSSLSILEWYWIGSNKLDLFSDGQSELRSSPFETEYFWLLKNSRLVLACCFLIIFMVRLAIRCCYLLYILTMFSTNTDDWHNKFACTILYKTRFGSYHPFTNVTSHYRFIHTGFTLSYFLPNMRA